MDEINVVFVEDNIDVIDFGNWKKFVGKCYGYSYCGVWFDDEFYMGLKILYDIYDGCIVYGDDLFNMIMNIGLC